MVADQQEFDAGLDLVLTRAASACSDLARENILDERTLTGAVLGALKVSHSVAGDSTTKIGWAIYNQGPATGTYSEGATGVDFGLLLVTQTASIRFAIFQAKRPTNVARTKIAANRTRTNNAGEEVSQLVTLHNASLELMQTCQPDAKLTIKDLDWVHYLAYCDPIRCVPLSSMLQQFTEEQDLAGNSKPFDAQAGVPFSDVLTSGANVQSKSWLTIGEVSGSNALPEYFREMPIVFIADETGLQMTLDKFVEKLCPAIPRPSSQASSSRVKR